MPTLTTEMMSAAEVVHPDLKKKKKSPFKIISAMKSGPSLPLPFVSKWSHVQFFNYKSRKIVQKNSGFLETIRRKNSMGAHWEYVFFFLFLSGIFL